MRTIIIVGCSVVSFALSGAAWAQSATTSASDDPAGTVSSSTANAETRREPPIVAYTYAAHGAEAKTLGVHAYGLGMVAAGQDGALGGGGTIWGSPIDRLTLIVDGQRNLSREFSPSAAAIFRLYGDGREGFSLGALGKFKIDGFAGGPDGDEVESEVEIGGLVSYRGAPWYLDVNAIAGRGTGDEGETDAEGKLRFGRELGEHVRVGIDGQVRARLAGPRYLANGRTWDFVAGPQGAFSWRQFYGALTAGPTTMALVTKNVGWSAIVSVGGVAF
jgi:hypothetical protein